MTYRRQSVLIEKRDLFRTFHQRIAAASHELRCQIEDDLDNRPITEGHAEGYDEMVAWLADQIKELHKQIESD